MATLVPVAGASTLVNEESGQISRDLFSSPEIYQEEQKKIFRRAWLYVAHESQVRNPGDFILSRMGEESVIVTRDRNMRVRVMLNSCRHRGMRVCRYDEGKTSRFYCPYHGWTYGLDGKLLNVPHERSDYGEAFRREDWGLHEVAQVATLHGLVFATWDAAAPDFDDYLGEGKMLLDLAFRAWDGEGEIEVLGSVQKWTIPSNWKLVTENFMDGLHPDPTHQSVEIIGINPNGEERGRRDAIGNVRKVRYYGKGHGGTFFDFQGVDRREYLQSSMTAEYFNRAYENRKRVLGDRASLISGVGTIFPNLAFHGHQPWTILIANPVSVNRTEMWRTYFVDKDAPLEVKQFLRRYAIRYSGPGGLVETDDLENWTSATAASSGAVCREFPFNYMAGMRLGQSDRVPGAETVSQASEQTALGLYSTWSSMMGLSAGNAVSPTGDSEHA